MKAQGRRVNRSFPISITLFLCGVFASCAATATPRYPSEASDSLIAAHDKLARSMEHAGPVDGFLPHVTGDIAYLHPAQEIITGRDATRKFLKSIHQQPWAVKTVLHKITGEASADGSVGYTFGWLEETSKANAAPATSYGRFIAAWRKRDGHWRVQGFLRLASTAPLGPVPPDALIVDGAPGIPQPGLRAAHELDIAIADSRFADLSVAQGYTVAFSSYTAEAAVVVAAGDFFWNRAGVEIAFGGWTPAESLAWHPLRVAAAASGDLGWSIGHGTFSLSDGSNVQRFYSKYLTVWIRTENGWRFLLDGGNSRPAP